MYPRQPPSAPVTASASLPRSTSASSLQSVNLSPPRATDPPRTSSFLFSSLAGVWAGLKAAAGVEVAGFVRGLSGGGGAAGSGSGEGGDERARIGEKRERVGYEAQTGRSRHGERRGKRRRVELGDELLFDGGEYGSASPLPPIHGYDALSSSPRSHRNPSTSPSSSRHPLRPYVDPSYADELLHASTSDEGLSTTLAPRPSLESTSRRSGEGSGLRSLSRKRKVDILGSTAGAVHSSASTTSALAPRGLHRRGYSHAAGLTATADTRATQPQSHVHFAPLPASSSLPNLAAVAASAPSPKTPGKGKAREREQVGTILLGEAGQQVERAWREKKEKDRTRRDKRRIEELEEEVLRLKGQLSAHKPPRSPFAKMPRVSAPPPPPPPPPPAPPPVGKPHPLLATARASLRATPERPKRRHSTIGGGPGPGIDMRAFLSELGTKRDKLRKVGLPRQKTQDDLRRTGAGAGVGGGPPTGSELNDVLGRAFQRKFARARGAPSPATPRVVGPSGSTPRPPVAPEWSPLPLGSGSLAASRSMPRDLAAHAHAHVRPGSQLRPLPATQAQPPPRTSSLVAAAVGVCTETTVYGVALSTDEPCSAAGPAGAGMSPSLSSSSLPSAPPERDSPREKLPGLEMGRSRPVTPARRRPRAAQLGERRGGDADAHVGEEGDTRAGAAADEGDPEMEGMEELVGCGERRADPARVFGRA